MCVCFLLQYYSTISEAISDVTEGDRSRIVVHPGVYNESLVIDKPVTIIGAGVCVYVCANVCTLESHHFAC